MIYPIFIMSYRRPTGCLTANMLSKAKIPFTIVIEQSDWADYRILYAKSQLLVCPDGSGIWGACEFIKNHAREKGYKRYWQMDDDIRGIFQWKAGKHSRMTVLEILTHCERFTDQYSNVGVAGISSFVFSRLSKTAYSVNSYPHTCILMRPDLPIHFSPDVECDVDFIIQTLALGYCTIKFSMFSFIWTTTESIKGGATDQYANGKRLERFRNTLKKWPIIGGIVPKKGGCGWRLTTERAWRLLNKQELIRDPKVKPYQLPKFIPYTKLTTK